MTTGQTDNQPSVDNVGTGTEQPATNLESIMLGSDNKPTAENKPTESNPVQSETQGKEQSGSNLPAWMCQLPSEMQGENGKSLEKFQKIGDLAKSYVELEKKMSSRVELPTETSSETDVKAFWSKMGKPEKPEDYKFAENLDPESKAYFSKLAFDSNLTDAQASKVFGDTAKLGENLLSTYREKQLQALKETEANLKIKYGNNFNSEMEYCKRGLVASGLAQILKESGLSGNQAIVEHFVNYGKMIAEDSAVTRSNGGSSEKTLFDGGLLI
jgi:hypothetical protein